MWFGKLHALKNKWMRTSTFLPEARLFLFSTFSKLKVLTFVLSLFLFLGQQFLKTFWLTKTGTFWEGRRDIPGFRGMFLKCYCFHPVRDKYSFTNRVYLLKPVMIVSHTLLKKVNHNNDKQSNVLADMFSVGFFNGTSIWEILYLN